MPTSTDVTGPPHVLVPAAARRAPLALLDRLFAPHGAAAYLRHLAPTASPGSSRPAPDTADAPEAPTTGHRPAPVTGDTVTFARSGGTVDACGTLLETAEAAGLTPRFRCRRGICGTCTSPLLAGAVVDARTGEVADEPGAVRLCVSRPQGAVTVDL